MEPDSDVSAVRRNPARRPPVTIPATGTRSPLRLLRLPDQIACYLRPMQQPFDLHRVIKRMIRLEPKIGRELQPQRMRHLPPQERRGTPESGQQRVHVRPPQSRYKRRSMFQVWRDPHFRDCQSRIGKLRIAEIAPLKQASQYVADFLCYAQLPLARSLTLRPLQAATSSVSKHSTTSPSCRSWKFANDNPHS